LLEGGEAERLDQVVGMDGEEGVHDPGIELPGAQPADLGGGLTG
jgi:hypothetical protein